MRTVVDVAEALGARTGSEKAAAWDPVGLQLGDMGAVVESVAVCHEVTDEVVEALRVETPDLLITYHPLLFDPTNRLTAGRSAEARAYSLVSMGVGLFVTHTDFDAAPGGSADALADLISLREVEPFGDDDADGPREIGRVGEFDASLDALDALLCDAFGHAGIRISGDRERHLEKVAVVPGSGSHLIEVAAGLADALVTGDVSHHRAVRATDLGLSIVDPGHIATERPGLQALVEMVGEITDGRIIDLTHIDPQTWQ
jgi:dinuclear metal center YbgI/SA1388 family protein